VAENLREGRVVRALRLSSRPPKAGSPLPPDLAGQLIQATEAALTADTAPQRWATVLDALAYSPIRRRVVPHSLPTRVGPELRTTIARFGVQLPEIDHIFDIEPEAAPARERPRPPRRAPRKPPVPNSPGKRKAAADGSTSTAGGANGTEGKAVNGSEAKERGGERAEAEPAGSEAPSAEADEVDALPAAQNGSAENGSTAEPVGEQDSGQGGLEGAVGGGEAASPRAGDAVNVGDG
jgi:hypothetical protein